MNRKDKAIVACSLLVIAFLGAASLANTLAEMLR